MKTIRDTVRVSVQDLIWESVWNGVNDSLRGSIVNDIRDCILIRVRRAELHVWSSMSSILRPVLKKSKELMNENI